MVNPCRGDRLADNLDQSRIWRRVGEFPIVANQFVAEIASPRLHRLAGGIIRGDALRPDQQQRIGLACLRVELALGQQLLACRPQCGGQRIAGAHRSLEIFGGQPDSLGLDDDGIGEAFEVDRPPPGLVGALVGNHGIRGTTAGRLLAGLLDLLPGRVDLSAELLQFRFRLALLLAIGVFDVFQLGDGVPILFEFGPQPPRVVFEVAEVEPRVGQLRLGRLAGFFALLDPPQHVFPLGLQLGAVFRGVFRRFGHGGGLGLNARRVHHGHQQRHQGAHRADQYREEREERDAGPRSRGESALRLQCEFHAA